MKSRNRKSNRKSRKSRKGGVPGLAKEGSKNREDCVAFIKNNPNSKWVKDYARNGSAEYNCDNNKLASKYRFPGKFSLYSEPYIVNNKEFY